jgi:hypothetical protein
MSTSDAVQLLTGYLGQLHTASGVFTSLSPALAKVAKDLETQKALIASLQDPAANFTREMANATVMLEGNKIGHAEHALLVGEATKKFLSADLGVRAMAAGHKSAAAAVKEHTAWLKEHKDVLDVINGVGPKRFGQLGSNTQAWAEEQAARERLVLQYMQEEASGNQAKDLGRDLLIPKSFAENAQKGGTALTGFSEEFKKAAEAMAEAEAKLGSMEQVMSGQLLTSAKSFTDTLVDAANGADASWDKFFESFAVGMQKAVAQALMLKALTGSVTGAAGEGGVYGGLFGALGIKGGRVGFDAAVPGGPGSFLPGFRTGGDMLVGGSGGPDTKIAAFRVSPGETIHVRTPEQHKAAAQSARGGTRTIVFEMPDGRRARFVTEDDFEELYLKATDRNAPAIRSRVTGR